MRITIVLPYAGLQGGIRVIATLAERLTRRGHRVELVSCPQTFRIRQHVKSLLLGRGLRKKEPSYLDTIDVAYRVLESVRPVNDEDVPDADVVLATHYTTALGVLRLSSTKGAKSIFIQDYAVLEGKPNPELDATWRMPLHKIVVSNWLAHIARQKFGDTSASVVPNSVDHAQFHAPPRGKAAAPTLGFVYSSTPLKGVATGLDALKRIATAIPGLRVVCFGAEQPSFTLRLPRFVEFYHLPPQDEIRRLYSQCDVWISSSITEGFSLPLVEAMACRCPVVSTRCGGPDDLIVEGENGYLVAVGDARALAERVLEVLRTSEKRWKQMSDAAYRRATAYTWDDAADRFEQALQTATEVGRRRQSCIHRPVTHQ